MTTQHTAAVPLPTPPRTRSAEELEYLLNWLPTSSYQRLYPSPQHPYMVGVRACAEWALGRATAAPVTRRRSAETPNGFAVSSEHGAAEAAMQFGAAYVREEFRLPDDASTAVFGSVYFTACENTLWWILGGRGIDVDEDQWPYELEFR